MPILDVEIVLRPGEKLDNNLASTLADRAARIFLAQPGSTWVKLRTLSHGNYAEDSRNSPMDVFPVFASVLKARLPAADKMQIEIAELTAAIAKECDRPEENVHILYLPEGVGRISFGGKLVSSNLEEDRNVR